MAINLIMAEFGAARVTAGDANLRHFRRLDPTLTTMLTKVTEGQGHRGVRSTHFTFLTSC